MFSQPVAHVGATKIFARVEGGEQLLAYEMAFAAAGLLAMVLPLPVPPGSRDEAVRFVDLSAYPGLFGDLDALFPQMVALGGFGPPPQASGAKLVVHDVGSFEASFVPTLADFRRLDARFRMRDDVWRALPAYRDFGFAVFKLKGGGQGLLERLGLRRATAPHRKVHPMALRFPTRDASTLFFPTVHVHDGRVRPTAHFDHALYCQAGTAPRPGEGGFTLAPDPVASRVSIALARGIVDEALPVFRMNLLGERPNADIVAALGA